MENYESEPVIEQYSDPVPFDMENDPSVFQIKIEGKSTRLRALVNHGLKNFGPGKKVIFVAQGRATTKAVSCVEIMKTYFKKPIHQITKITQVRTTETWHPIVEGLDPISVTRAIPIIYILISQEPLANDETGYQVYNHRETNKVLNLRVIEENEAKQEEATENLNNTDPMNDQKENLPADLTRDFELLNVKTHGKG